MRFRPKRHQYVALVLLALERHSLPESLSWYTSLINPGEEPNEHTPMTIEEAVARRAPLAHGASLFQRGILMAVKVVRRRELTFWEKLYIPQIELRAGPNAAPAEVATSLAPAIVPAVAGTHGSSDPRWLASIPTTRRSCARSRHWWHALRPTFVMQFRSFYS